MLYIVNRRYLCTYEYCIRETCLYRLYLNFEECRVSMSASVKSCLIIVNISFDFDLNAGNAPEAKMPEIIYMSLNYIFFESIRATETYGLRVLGSTVSGLLP
jgi:hypothetical protein